MKKLALASTGLVALSRLGAVEDEKMRMVKTLGMGALTAYVAVKVAALHRRWKEKKEKNHRSEDEKVVGTEENQPRIRIKAMRGGSRSRSSSPPPPRVSVRPANPAPRPGATNEGPTIGMDQHPLGGTDGSRDRPRNKAIAHTMFWGRHCVQLYIADRNCNVPGSEMDDYWDYDADECRVRRHHCWLRTEFFGHDYFDPAWRTCPIPRWNLLRQRRTTLLNLDGRVICFTDCWTFTEPNEQLRPRVCDYAWWGFTDFVKRGGEDITYPPQPPPGPPDPDDDDEEYGEEQEEEEDLEVSSTEVPDSQERSSQVPREPEGEPASGSQDLSEENGAIAGLGHEQEIQVHEEYWVEGGPSKEEIEAAFAEVDAREARRSMTSRSGLVARGTTSTIMRSSMFIATAASLPRSSNGQPSGGSDDTIYWEMWALGGTLMFLYTCVVILASVLCLWCFLKSWREPLRRDYGNMVGDEDIQNRLWFDEDDLQPGGVWESPMGGEDQVAGEFSTSEVSGFSDQEEVERRGQLLQARPKNRVYRPGHGTMRVGRISSAVRRREVEAAATSSRTASSVPEARPGIVRRRLRGESSSATFEGSDSEMATSVDTEGRVRMSRATRDLEAASEGSTLENPGLMGGNASGESTLDHPDQGGNPRTVTTQSDGGVLLQTGGKGSGSGPSASTEQGQSGALLQGDGRIGGSRSSASTGGDQQQVASFLVPERREIFYAATGQVYHLRKSCGKLKAAKRIFGQPNCLVCAAQPPNRRSLKLDRDVYHDVDGCSSSIVNWLRPCHECAGG